jgi:ubiquinone/menaquinone biosynthesis C-methylase UbiE
MNQRPQELHLELLDETQLAQLGAAEIRGANRTVQPVSGSRVDRECPLVLLVREQERLPATGGAQRIVCSSEERAADPAAGVGGVNEEQLGSSPLTLSDMETVQPPRTHRDIAAETERVRRLQDREAPRYDRRIAFFERVLFGDGRQWVCRRAQGRVLELAAGTARNLPYYPIEVTVVGIELSEQMLAIGQRRAHELGRDADLRLGDAQALEFPDQSFDTIVCTLGLCTIPDPRRAVAEARRVLRPGGHILLLEHVRSPLLPVRLLQRLFEPLAVRFAADHLTREPLDYLAAEGFEIERLERSKWGIVERVSARVPAPR